MSTQRSFLTDYIAQQYAVSPEFLWRHYPNYAVFRHAHNQKWFAIIMRVSGSLIGKNNENQYDIVNLKLPPEWVTQLSGQQGFAPAYHMNKRHWLSVYLDNSLPEKQLLSLLHESFTQTK